MNYIKPHWPAPASIRAYTTTKRGWGKPTVDREEISKEEDQDLKKLLQLPAEPLWINQTHSNIAIEATHANKNQIADASFSNLAQRICVVMTADCLPLLICNQQGTQVAAVHAGWKGLAAGVIEETLYKLNQPAEQTLVWLGPAIGAQKFEVGKDVYDAFTSKHADSAAAFKPYKEGKWLADLYALAKIRLNLQGVTKIYGGDYCTYTQEDLFFSYRREGKNTGRMASLIWIDENT